MQSALEREVLARLASVRVGISRHDRAVVLGFALSLVPLLPISFVGFVLTIFNAALVCAGRLGRTEMPLLAGAAAAFFVYALLWGMVLSALVHSGLVHGISGFLGRIPDFLHGVMSGPTGLSSRFRDI